MESSVVPMFGAIFMSNRRTREECFARKLFGLPYLFADFVHAVKAGMVLFLFEYENKNLYGVFEAVSDGAMDIVPDAYISSGKKFPAQVRFHAIWNCSPLPESVFRDAIKDNYYKANKFLFSLSKEQVSSLLWLFESRKVVRVQKSLIGKSKRHLSRSSHEVKPSVDSGILIPDKGASMIDSEALKSAAEPSSARSESVPLHNTSELVDVSSCGAYLGVEDYIPLSSPESPEPLKDPSDIYSGGKVMYCDLQNKKASVFSRLNLMPKVVDEKSESVPLHNATELVDVSSCGPYLGVEDYIPLSSHESTEPLKDPSDIYSGVKVMYCDLQNKKASVFSRLNLMPKVVDEKNNSGTNAKRRRDILPQLESVFKGTAQEEHSKFAVGKSVDEIMDRLLHGQENWAPSIEEAKRNVAANGSRSLNRRPNVFSRLKLPSESDIKEDDVNTKLDEMLNKINEMVRGKKKRRIPEEIFADERKEDMTIRAEMIENASGNEVLKYLNYEQEATWQLEEVQASAHQCAIGNDMHGSLGRDRT